MEKPKVSFENLPPLKKWILSNKYFIKSSETKEKKSEATHYLLDGGIWKVPLGEYSEFLRLLSVDLQNGEKYYISENRTKVFKFICDLDFYENEIITIPQIEKIVNLIQEVVGEYYTNKTVIICGTDSKTVKIEQTDYIKTGFHLVWPKIWITVELAKELRLRFIEILSNSLGVRSSINSWEDVVDLAVYEDNGLRMIGCRKMGMCKNCKKGKIEEAICETCGGSGKKDENRVYKPKSVLDYSGSEGDGVFLKNISTDYYVMLLETSITNYAGNSASELIKELPTTLSKVKPKKKGNPIKISDDLTIKIENCIKKCFKTTHSKVKIKKITKVDEHKYFVEPDDNFCINVNRCHTSSGIYFQIRPTGISQRCFCKKTTTCGRSFGSCKDFASPEIGISKILQNILFGTNCKKKIINFTLSRTESSDKFLILNNCKNILFQLENELI